MDYTSNNYGSSQTNSSKLKEITLMMPESMTSYYLGRLFNNRSSTSSNSYVYGSLGVSVVTLFNP